MKHQFGLFVENNLPKTKIESPLSWWSQFALIAILCQYINSKYPNVRNKITISIPVYRLASDLLYQDLPSHRFSQQVITSHLKVACRY